ncbi:hypothetical protein CN120_04660 [Sinorhizobium meliloti]|nr:DUF6065 family protein [Sinorhizobium meliloti]ARS69176.1 hypothetical protein SMRU11_12680 [Sinorhizobium meliloti RU11/001]ASP69428.1 hypothetical protein CDO29_26865 [Sinorhizobium meliloti]MDW9440634.1 hypothetical protein [Sinorhizobium meliloti]MDW9573018.1 hypothetical protein [Sinorhizobium meliloti]MQV22974.1 hypothetical protein [Sinorhizobium meliloti]
MSHLSCFARRARGRHAGNAQLSENPELEGEYKAWSDSRNSFNKGLNDPNSDAVREKWQKSYFRGVCPAGRNGPEDHRSRLKLKPFG